MMVKRDPRRTENIACRLRYRGEAVSKDVNAVMATIKSEQLCGNRSQSACARRMLLYPKSSLGTMRMV